MSQNRDTCISPVEYFSAAPAGDEPIFDDRPLTGNFREPAASISHRVGDFPSPAGIRSVLLGMAVRTNAFLRRRHGGPVALRRLDPFVAFVREMLASPRAMGAVCPSSRHLARAMARELHATGDGLVVELGAGTGNITRALLQHGIDPARLVAVERSPALAALLRRRYPQIRVIEGDATRLRKLLGPDAREVRAVVSALPLRSLPGPVVQRIMGQIRQLLPEEGVLVQFTYDLRTPSVGRDQTLQQERSRVVWKNFPPARVDTFARRPAVGSAVNRDR